MTRPHPMSPGLRKLIKKLAQYNIDQAGGFDHPAPVPDRVTVIGVIDLRSKRKR